MYNMYIDAATKNHTTYKLACTLIFVLSTILHSSSRIVEAENHTLCTLKLVS